MSHPSILQHPGTVSKIENGIIYVDIQVESACAKCHAHSYCTAFGKKDKIIEIEERKYPEVTVNDRVNVIIRESLGMQALLLGYIFPVIVLVIALFITYGFTAHEGLSALVTLIAVGIYYLMLVVMKNKIRKHFTFSLEKL
jgi:positive regulator of sigma E activity